MDKFKIYIGMVTAFILTASIFMSMIPNGTTKYTVKFVMSVILMGIILSPISKLKVFDINLYTNEYTINNEIENVYDTYAAEKVQNAVCKAVADFAEKKNMVVCDSEVITQNGKIEKVMIDKALAAYITEISNILGIPKEYIQTSE